MGIITCSVFLCCWAGAYEDAMSNTNMDIAAKWCFEDGHKIMQIKGVGAGDPLSFCGSWQIPQSISHNGALFSVTNINDAGAFELYDEVAGTKVKAKLMRFENEEIARLRTFVRFGACDFGPESLAKLLTVSNITSNALFVDDPKNSSPNAFLVYKNLSLNLIAATNRFDFALALLNAGLPEGERLNVGQHNVPICEGDR